MRIVFAPCVTHTLYATESEIIQFTRFARTIWKHDGAISYLLIPNNMADDAEIKDEPPYLFNVRTGPWKRFHVAMGCMPDHFDKLVNDRFPQLFADAVVTTRTGIGGYMQRQLWSEKDTFIPVFIQEQMAADYGWPMVKSIDDIDLAARSLSYAICQPLFSTKVEKQVALKACRRFLNASLCKKIDEKSPVFAPGISFTAVKKAVKKAAGRKNRSFTVFFGGRLNEMKRAKQLIRIYDRFYAAGRPIRIVITSPLISVPVVPPEIEVYGSLNTEQFLEKCCKAHVLLASSRVEGFTAGLHEMMATGIVTLLPRLPWAEVLLKDKWKDYPFKYSTFTQAYQLLVWIYENYEEAKAKVAWMPQWLEDNVTEECCSLQIYDWMKKIIERRWPPKVMGRPTKPNRNAQLVLGTVEELGADKFTLRDVLYAIASDDRNLYSAQDWSLRRRGRATGWMVYRYLSGHPDFVDCGGRQPAFTRR